MAQPRKVMPNACFTSGKNGHVSRKSNGRYNDTIKECFVCGEWGHIARDCPQRGLGNSCFKCGQQGHMTRECLTPQACVNSGRGGHVWHEYPTRQGCRAGSRGRVDRGMRGRNDFYFYSYCQGFVPLESTSGTNAKSHTDLNGAMSRKEKAMHVRLVEATKKRQHVGGALQNSERQSSASALRMAVMESDEDLVRRLRDEGSLLDDALIDGVMNSDEVAVQRLLERGASPNATDRWFNDDPAAGCNTALFLATEWGWGNAAVVGLLLAAGAEVDGSSKDGLAPIQESVWHGNVSVAQQLLDAGADCSRTFPDGNSLLHCAVQKPEPSADLVRLLLQHCDREDCANVRARNALGATPLICAASSNTPVECVRLLLAAGSAVEAVTLDDTTALCSALNFNRRNQHIATVLIQHGARPSLTHLSPWRWDSRNQPHLKWLLRMMRPPRADVEREIPSLDATVKRWLDRLLSMPRPLLDAARHVIRRCLTFTSNGRSLALTASDLPLPPSLKGYVLYEDFESEPQQEEEDVPDVSRILIL